MSILKITPKPRELSDTEIDCYNLRYYKGGEIKPAYESTGNAFSSMDTGNLPTYRLYNAGTNHLLILRYTPSKDIWEEVGINDIGNLYGIVWLMCIKLESNQVSQDQDKNSKYDVQYIVEEKTP